MSELVSVVFYVGSKFKLRRGLYAWSEPPGFTIDGVPGYTKASGRLECGDVVELAAVSTNLGFPTRLLVSAADGRFAYAQPNELSTEV